MPDETPPQMDYDEHYKTYKLFINLSVVATAAIAAILIGMAIFLL